MALQESESQVEQFYMELSYVHSSSSIADNQLNLETITQEDVRGTHDMIAEPLVIMEHEHLDELALVEKYVP